VDKIQRVWVPVPTTVSPSGTAAISFIHWPAVGTSKASVPLLLIHGFDSSCLEFRRLGPKLSALGIDTYAVDLLGWGFTQLNSKNDSQENKISSYSAQAKLDALVGFWNAVGDGRPFCIGGASLGGAAAIEISTMMNDKMKDLVQGLILIDAQGFVDGVGPMATLPGPIASLGVQVLKSYPLRNVANQMSYFDKAQFATDDALRIGRLHCTREGWEEALLSFMMSGGFSPSGKVSQVKVPTLIVWGRDDVILEKDFPQKFVDLIPDSQLEWIENCGHVPHLEKSEDTANVIASFVKSKVSMDNKIARSTQTTETVVSFVWGIGAGAAIVGTLMDSGIISPSII
jgi:pimeloyl-ACP methyl ester carboxylesterase